MSENEPKNRWGIIGIICMDCGQRTYTDPRPTGVHAVYYGGDRSTKALLLVLPLKCPTCDNLRSRDDVEEEEAQN